MLAHGRSTCFWPGLASAWFRGDRTGLALALLAAWYLTLLLVATCIWSAWLPVFPLRFAWLVLLCGWLYFVVRNHWQFAAVVSTAPSLNDTDRFVKAQRQYLAGNWFEAEALLLDLMQHSPRDAEVQLLLVGVLRRTRRWRPALRRLEHLELLDSASQWHFEMIRERLLLEQKLNESTSESDEHTEANALATDQLSDVA